MLINARPDLDFVLYKYMYCQVDEKQISVTLLAKNRFQYCISLPHAINIVNNITIKNCNTIAIGKKPFNIIYD